MLINMNEGYGKPKEDKGPQNSFWDKFLLNVGNAVTTGLKNLGNTGVGEDIQGIVVEQTTKKDSKLQKDLETLRAFAASETGQKVLKTAESVTSPAFDVLLQAGNIVEKAWSNVVARPLSTAALLTDNNSPLYEDGFQLTDIRKAWDRSEKVSYGQALPKSFTFRYLPGGMTLLNTLAIGGVDLNKVDLWDDKSLKQYYEDSPTGKIFSGSFDTALNLVGGKGIDDGVRALARIAGATTKITKLDDIVKLEDDAAQHIAFITSNGQTGGKTTYGQYVETLADSTNIEEITKVTSLFSNNERLPYLISQVNDPNVVSDMILADKGYVPAIERLLDTNADVFYTLGDMQGYMIAKHIDDPFLEFNDEVARLSLAHDAAIRKNPVYQEIWDTFMDQSGLPKSLGNDWKPTSIAFVENVRLGRIKNLTALSSGNLKNTGTFMGITLGAPYVGGPTTVLLKQVTSGMPKGYFRTNPVRAFENLDEIKSTFDDLKFLRNNNAIIRVERVGVDAAGAPAFRTDTVANVRQSILNRFAATRPEDMPRFIDEFNAEIGQLMAMNLDINQNIIDYAIKEAGKNSGRIQQQLRDRGFYFDEIGNRVVVDPVFAGQLADVVPMLPWRQIERLAARLTGNIKDKSVSYASEATEATFNFAQRIFSTNVLVTRPSYTLKNAAMAPMTDELMYFGRVLSENGIGPAVTRWASNRRTALRGIFAQAALRAPKSKYRVVSKEINQLSDALDNLMAVRDDRLAEYILLASGDLSPTIAKQRGQEIINGLKEMDEIVTAFEKQVNDIVPGVRTDGVPTLYEIWRRVEYLKNSPIKRSTNALEFKLRQIVEQQMGLNAAAVRSLEPLDLQIQKLLEEANGLIAQMASKKVVQAEELIKVLPYKKRDLSYGDTFIGSTDRGTKVTIDDLFNENQFGSAMRAEFSAGTTQQLTMTNEIRLASKAGQFNRLTVHGTVKPSDPEYFEQLAYYINRYTRNDEFTQVYLSDPTNTGIPFDDMLKWAYSKEGKAYFNLFNVEEDDIVQAVAERINHIDRYFPSTKTRQMMMQGEVNAAELQLVLGSEIGRLTPIVSTDFDSMAALIGAGSNTIARAVADNVKNIERALFTTFATAPEDAISRFPAAAELFRQNMVRRANLLEEQNLPIERINEIRQGATRETLKQMEQIFYTIPRQNRAIFASRILASFPQAAVSGLVRYTRFAIAHPGRAVIGLQAYRDTYESYGVDKYGNRVPINEAKYMLIPFSKEIQELFGVKHATGVRVPRNAFNYVLNSPGASWLLSVGTASVINAKPDKEQTLKSILGESGFNLLFPGGFIPKNPANVFLSGYQRDLLEYLDSNDSNEEWLLTVNQAAQYANSEWEANGRIGDAPSNADVENLAKQWYRQSIFTKFFIGFGAQVEMPGQIGRDIYYALLQKNDFDVLKTRAQMEKKFGDWSSWYTVSTSETGAPLPATQETYRRIWKENNDLARQLAEIDIDSPEVVGVLVADVDDEFSSAVYNYLLKAEIPGTSVRVKRRLTLDQFTRRKKISDGWQDYIATKKNFDNAVVAMGDKVMNDELRAQWNFYLTGDDPTGELKKQYPDLVPMKKAFPEWYDEFASGYTSDTGYKWAKALDLIVNNKKFMDKNGKRPFWKTVTSFLVDREMATRYAKDPNYTASSIQEQFSVYVKEEYGTPGQNKYNEKFYNFYLRYLENDALKGL